MFVYSSPPFLSSFVLCCGGVLLPAAVVFKKVIYNNT